MQWKNLTVRLDSAVIELLKKLAKERGLSQAKMLKELILGGAYK